MIIRIIAFILLVMAIAAFGFAVHAEEQAFWKHRHHRDWDNDSRQYSDPEGWSERHHRWYPHHRCWSEEDQWHTCYETEKAPL